MDPAKKRKYVTLLLAAGLIALLVFLFFALFDIAGVAESRIKAGLSESSEVKVHVESRPRWKIWLGSIDSLTVSAMEVKRFSVPLEEMDVQAHDIRVDIMGLLRHEMPNCIRQLHVEGIIQINETVLSELLTRKAPAFTHVEVKLSQGTVHLALKTDFASVATLKGSLTIRDSTKIYLNAPEIYFKSLRFKEKHAGALLDRLNPLIDIEEINFASPVFKNISETERKKWKIQVTGIEVQEGILQVSFTAVKKETL